MQITSFLLLAISAIIGLTTAMPADPTTSPLELCGTARFSRNEYKCYNNKSLCPIKGGITYELCAGDGGCFDPSKYHCTNGHVGRN